MADDLAYLASLSEHPDRPGDTTNFNPAFSSALANALRQARAAGLPVGVMSGFREPGQTGSAYDAGGNSSHTYGLASDISGLDGPNGKVTQAWAQIAEANGLHNPYGVGNAKEFNHWQLPPQPLEQNPKLLASLKTAYATGNFQNVWNAYTSGGGPSRVATTTPGTTLNSPVDIVLRAESGDRNINNTTQGTSSGQAQGYAQITTGTWNDFAPKAGVDLKQYPTPDSAPRNVQLAVANTIPLNRWASSTVNAVTKQYPNIDTSKTLGEVQAAALGGAGGTAVASAAPGTTINTTGAGGGAVLPGFADAKTSNQFLQNLDQFDKSLGGRGLGLQGQGQGEGQGQPDIRPSPLMPGAGTRNVSSPQSIGMTAQQMLPQLTHYQPQAYGQTLNSDPLAIGAGTPQQPDWLKNAGLQQAAQPSPYGTSIGSMQMAFGLSPQQLQMLMNPMMLNQSGGFS